jgi:hypothetical protein
MDRLGRDADMPGNEGRWWWSNQGVSNTHPPTDTPEGLGVAALGLDLCFA